MTPFTDINNTQAFVTVLKSVDGKGFSSKSYEENVRAVIEKFTFSLISIFYFHIIALLSVLLWSKAIRSSSVTQKTRNRQIDKLLESQKGF